MSSLKDEALEAYVLGNCDKKAFSGLIKGTDSCELLNCLHILNQAQILSQEDKARIKKYISSFSTANSRQIELRYILREYEESEKEEERTTILDNLKKKLSIELEEYPPSDLKKGVDLDLGAKEKRAPNELSKSTLDIKSELELLYSGNKGISNYNITELIGIVDFNRLKEADFISICGNQRIAGVKDEGFFKRFESIAKVEIYKHKYLHHQQILDNLSIWQLEQISKSYPRIKEEESFAGKYLQKKFARELDPALQDLISLDDKQRNLLTIYEHAKTLPKKFESLKVDVLLEILENGIKLNSYSFPLFEEYLRKPARKTKITMYKDNSERGKWSQFIGNVQDRKNREGSSYSNYTDEDNLVREYLREWFRMKKEFGKWKGLLDDKYLNSVYESLKQDAGEEVEITKDNSTMLEQLGAESYIKFKGDNKELFEIGESLQVKLSIKNIERIWMKVFEMNSENYYRNKLAPFQTDVNLEGVVASFESVEETKESQGGRVIEKCLSLDMLHGKVGLFIVEVIGGGCSSRAVIKIGTLSWVYKSTMIGQLAYIIGPDRKICADNTTGLWLDNQFFPADPKTGRIVIPYAKNQHSSKVILIHHSIAQLVNFTRPSAVFGFSAGFLLPSESLIMGNTADIIIKPKLTLNGLKAPLKMLNNVRATINTRSYIDDIPHSKTFNNLTVSENEEIKLSFNVAPQLSLLNVDLQIQVFNKTLNKKQDFSDSKSFDLDCHTDKDEICTLFLKNIGGIYIMEMLGKNGEGKKGHFIKVYLQTNYLGYELSETLETNEGGGITLGALRDATLIRAEVEVDSITINRKWYLAEDNIYMYPSTLDIIKKERIELPVDGERMKELNPATSNLLYISINGPTNSYFDHLKLVKGEGSRNSILRVENLGEEGKYLLYFPTPKGTREIWIEVHNGEYWGETEGYILKKYSLIESMQKNKILKIDNIHVEKEKTTIILKDTNAHPRVHFMAFNYLPSNTSENLNILRTNTECTFTSTQYFFQKWKNFYLSNRQLGTEYRYVFDRKHLKAYTGITLDKPKLLLKRVFTKGTTTSEEEIYEAEHFAQRSEALQMSSQEYYPMRQQMVPEAAMMQQRIPEAMMMNQMIPTAATSYSQQRLGRSRISIENIDMYQNFLGTEPLIVSNAIPDASGTIVIKGYMSAYNSILILGVDDHCVTQSLIPSIPLGETNKRNLCLDKALDENKYYSEQREATTHQLGENVEFGDMNTIQMQIVDSQEKVLQVLNLVTKIKGNVQYLEDFKFLLNWHSFPLEEKHKHLSIYTSHELHLFLKFKDKEYFQSVVLPHISNKLEKSFMDLYLLGDINSLKKYLNPHLLSELNAMERAFLVEALAPTMPNEAKFIVESMKEQNEFAKTSVEQQNRIFDAILSLQVMEKPTPVVHGMDERSRDIMRPLRSAIAAESYGGFGGGMQGVGGAMPRGLMNYRNECESDSYSEECEREESKQNDLFGLGGDAMAYNVDPYSQNIRQGRGIVEEMDETKEYAETHYYKRTAEDTGMTSKMSKFWESYGEHCLQNTSAAPFVSQWFWLCCSGIADVVGCLSVLSLPPKSGEHTWTKIGKGTAMQLRLSSPAILVTKQVKESVEEEKKTTDSVLVGQKMWKYNKRTLKGWEIAQGDEILANSMIGIEVVMSNMGGDQQEINCLVQIPEGAIPLGKSSYSTSKTFKLAGYSTSTFEYSLYFPHPGDYMHYGATVSVGGAVIGTAKSRICHVVTKRTIISSENFMDVVASGNKGKILEFIEFKNIFNPKYGFSWHYIYWMLYSDKEFFRSLIELLMKKKIFVQKIWAYSFNHGHIEGIKVYLNSDKRFKQSVGATSTQLLTVDEEDLGLKHLDYYPLINPRAHSAVLKNKTNIRNETFRKTFSKFMLYLTEKGIRLWNEKDRLNLTQYLFQQERMEEAIEVFKIIDQEMGDNEGGIQIEYIRAYVDFLLGFPDFKRARNICSKYLNYSVLSWRLLFVEMWEQLEEYLGNAVDEDLQNLGGEELTDKKKAKGEIQEGLLAAQIQETELQIEFTQKKGPEEIEIDVKYYLIDLEVLFSRKPELFFEGEMAKGEEQDLSYVQPHTVRKQKAPLRNGIAIFNMVIEEEFRSKNILFEVRTQGQNKFVTYYSNQLKVQIYDNFGELKVQFEGKIGQEEKYNTEPTIGLSKAYIKCFSKMKSGGVLFYKDGYTDIRGVFDYLSLNTPKFTKVDSFVLFIAHPQYGSTIKTAKPPAGGMTNIVDPVLQVRTNLANKFNYRQQQKAISKAKK